MLHYIGRADLSPPSQKPKRRVKKHSRDPAVVVKEAAKVGDAQFQHYIETGKLSDSK